MAYYIRSLQMSNQHLILLPRSLYDTFMVAEHAFIDPRHEDDNEKMVDCINDDGQSDRESDDTKFVGDIMPIEFDPMEVERRIKSELAKIFSESQNQLAKEMMASIDALNEKLSSECNELSKALAESQVKLAESTHSLNAKVDAVKSAQIARAVQDDHVSRTIDGNVANLSDDMAKVWKALATEADTRQENINDMRNSIISTITEHKLSHSEIKSKADGVLLFSIQTPQNVLESTSIQNLEKTKDESMQWFAPISDTFGFNDPARAGWMSKLKIALMRIDEDYESIMNSTEKVLKGLSIDGWKLFIKNITIACAKTEDEMDKLKRDLYSVLIDKCTESQTRAFENDEKG